MQVELQDSVYAEIIEGNNLQSYPTWSLTDLSLDIGPYFDGESHEQHYLETIGSGSWYFSDFDEFRFDKIDQKLQSVRLHLPEQEIITGEDPTLWLNEKELIGSLVLLSTSTFNPEPTRYRWMDNKGQILFCKYDDQVSFAYSKLRLRIAPEFNLLFVNKKLYGWILFEPIDFLLGNEKELPVKENDDEAGQLLFEYLEIVNSSNIEKMENKDTNTLNLLNNLYFRLNLNNNFSRRRKILAEAINNILDRFYQ